MTPNYAVPMASRLSTCSWYQIPPFTRADNDFFFFSNRTSHLPTRLGRTILDLDYACMGAMLRILLHFFFFSS